MSIVLSANVWMFSYLLVCLTGGQPDRAEAAEIPGAADQEDGLSRGDSHEETYSLSTVQGNTAWRGRILVTVRNVTAHDEGPWPPVC